MLLIYVCMYACIYVCMQALMRENFVYALNVCMYFCICCIENCIYASNVQAYIYAYIPNCDGIFVRTIVPAGVPLNPASRRVRNVRSTS